MQREKLGWIEVSEIEEREKEKEDGDGSMRSDGRI